MPRRLSCRSTSKSRCGFPFVEGGVRLVEDEQARLLQKHARELDELLLPDAEATDRHVHVESQAEAVEQIGAAFLHGADRDKPAPQRFTIDEQIRQNRALRKQA